MTVCSSFPVTLVDDLNIVEDPPDGSSPSQTETFFSNNEE